MNIPTRYACDPPWWVVIWNIGTALALLVLVGFHGIKPALGLTVACMLALLAALVAIRRLVLRRYVELERDAILLPTGFLQLWVARIPYDAILEVREAPWAFGTVLYIRTGERKYEIPCGIRINRNDYVTVRNYLMARKGNEPQPATPPYSEPAARSPQG
jgi:hypothetical protein